MKEPTSYCALLSGIGPGNPNQRNDKLRSVFERLGFSDVASVISSGNILFVANSADRAELEDRIQAALVADLQIESGTIIRHRAELSALIARNPFGGLEHGSETYLTMTFFKNPPERAIDPLTLPPLATGRAIDYDSATACLSVVSDNSQPKGPNVMTWLEKNFGKQITTRTWLTVQRIVKKMPIIE